MSKYTLTENQQKQIDEIMDHFDFDKVAKVMDFLKWTWHGSEFSPEVYELRARARDLLKESVANAHRYNQDFGGTSTGGFVAKYVKGSDEDGPWEYFDLLFYVDHWTTQE